MDEIGLLEAVRQKKLHVLGGEISHKARGDKLTLSGYVSTKQRDLSGDICPPESWEELLPLYEANPLYCYSHDIHEKTSYPIGRVNKVFTDAEGLFFDEIVLSNIPVVKDILGPLIQDGVLKQQSAGFYCLKKVRRGNDTILLKNFLQEGSLVPFAANPFGTEVTMKTIEGLESFTSVDLILKAYQEGKLVIAGKTYSVPANYGDGTFLEAPNTRQDINKNMTSAPKIMPIEHAADQYDPSGEAVAKPPVTHKSFGAVADLIFAAAEVNSEGKVEKHLYQIGVPTAKGFKYDFEKLACVTGQVLGARQGAHRSGEETKALLGRLAAAYGALGKKFPSYCKVLDGSLADMAAWKLEDIAFSEVIFHEGEGSIIKGAYAKKDATNLLNALKAGDLPSLTEVEELRKFFYGNASLSVSVPVGDGAEADDLELFQAILSLIANFMQEDAMEDAQDAMDSALEGCNYNEMARKFVRWDEDGNLRVGRVVKATEKSCEVREYAYDGEAFVAKDRLTVATSALAVVKSLPRWNRARALAEKSGDLEVALGEDFDGVLSADEICNKYISAAERRAIPEEDFAGPNHTFPIRNQKDVRDAASLLHHAADPSAVKKKIIEIAHRKGLRLPATWEHKKPAKKAAKNRSGIAEWLTSEPL